MIGHVDTGKSSISAKLLYNTGVFTDRDLTKVKNYANLLDTEEQERVRGKTHEFSIHEFQYKDEDYNLLDSPGHKSFVRSMIESISLYKNLIGVLVVSVVENEFRASFTNGMLKEQVILARAAGIQQLIVCFNKMDTINWGDYSNIKNQLTPFLKSMKFKALEYIEVSAHENKGLDTLLEKIKKYTEIEIDNTKPLESIQPAPTPTNQITAKCKILYAKQIITAGFQCIIHINGKEYEVEILKIRKKTFIVTGDIAEIIFTFNEPVCVPSKEKLIIRLDDYTIGFGTYL